MQWILESVQHLVNLVFLLVVILSGVGTYIAYRMYERRHMEFPWQKPAAVMGVEVATWILFNIFWDWFQANFWAILIIVLIIVFILSRKKRG